MSLANHAFLFEKYGPRLTLAQLADFLHVTERTLYNQISAGACPVKTYREGKSRFADVRDVAAYLDQVRELAA